MMVSARALIVESPFTSFRFFVENGTGLSEQGSTRARRSHDSAE